MRKRQKRIIVAGLLQNMLEIDGHKNGSVAAFNAK